MAAADPAGRYLEGTDRYQQGRDDLLRQIQPTPQRGGQADEIPSCRGAQQVVGVGPEGGRLPLRRRRELEPRRHRGAVTGGRGVPEPMGQGQHGPVVGQDLGGEVPDALLRGPLGQFAQEDGAQATPLPGVDDGDGHLGLVRLPRVADEPRHPDQLPGVGSTAMSASWSW